jgi:hypothetical protein
LNCHFKSISIFKTSFSKYHFQNIIFKTSIIFGGIMVSKSIDNFNQQLQANILAHFSSQLAAEQAVLTLKQAGFDTQKLSLVQLLSNEIVVKKARSSAPWGQYPAKSGAGGGGYWICLLSGIVGLWAGVSLLFTAGMSLLVIAYPIVSVLLGWLVVAAMGGLVESWGDQRLPSSKLFPSSIKAQPQDLIIWITGSTEDIHQAKQILVADCTEATASGIWQ